MIHEKTNFWDELQRGSQIENKKIAANKKVR